MAVVLWGFHCMIGPFPLSRLAYLFPNKIGMWDDISQRCQEIEVAKEICWWNLFHRSIGSGSTLFVYRQRCGCV